jgi:hypothetical protein
VPPERYLPTARLPVLPLLPNLSDGIATDFEQARDASLRQPFGQGTLNLGFLFRSQGPLDGMDGEGLAAGVTSAAGRP